MTRDEIPIWLDCDPGHDDAVAILLSCFHPAFKVHGISSCYGNSSPQTTLDNLRSLLTAMGKAGDVHVYRGAQRPWFRSPVYAPDIHGISGLDGTTLLPTPTNPIMKECYLDAVEKAILANDGELSFVSTGALTSIATIMKEKPHLKLKVKFIAIMGGGLDIGNVNPNKSAEFNIWVDPDASNYLLTDPILKDKIILTPLNLTHKAIATSKLMKQILGSNDINLRKLYYELFQFFQKTYKNSQGFEKGPPIHDPVALMPLLFLYRWVDRSALEFQYKRYDFSVIVEGSSPDLGKLIVEKEYSVKSDRGTIFGLDMNFEYFWKVILYVLERAEKCSTIEAIERKTVKPLLVEKLKNTKAY